MEARAAEPKPCRRCNEREAILKIRSESICGPCYRRFVNVKTVKRLEKLAAEIGAAPTRTKRVLVGLSLGASSAGLVDILSDLVKSQLRKRPSAAFDAVVVHVWDDTATSRAQEQEQQERLEELLGRYAQRYPHFKFVRVPLSTAMGLDVIDWAALASSHGARADTAARTGDDTDAPATSAAADPTQAPAQARAFLSRLASPTSQADVRRLLVRHVLLATAAREDCRALLLGGSTTSLAETTLAETAKGRGFSLPWMVSDGPVLARRPAGRRLDEEGDAQEASIAKAPASSIEEHGESAGAARLVLYHPNRELFRGELERYATLVEPPLTDLIAGTGDASGRSSTAAVVSHRDISIDEVMTRYFADVEQNYPSVVANVVRTMAKLNRPDDKEGETCCALCGMALDELGDERWKGEIGDDGGGDSEKLCYGCWRAIHDQ